MHPSIPILACALLLGACGLKGPLYLPKDKPAPAPAAKPAADKPQGDKSTTR